MDAHKVSGEVMKKEEALLREKRIYGKKDYSIRYVWYALRRFTPSSIRYLAKFSSFKDAKYVADLAFRSEQPGCGYIIDKIEPGTLEIVVENGGANNQTIYETQREVE